jgi:hypothetical protein
MAKKQMKRVKTGKRSAKKRSAKTAAPSSKPRARNPRSNGRPIIIRGYTIGAIGRGIGKSTGYVSRCLRNQRRPSVRTLEALRVFLDLPTLDEAGQLFAGHSMAKGAKDVKAAKAKVEGGQAAEATEVAEAAQIPAAIPAEAE